MQRGGGVSGSGAGVDIVAKSEDAEVESDSPLVGLAYAAVSAVTLAILLSLAIVVLMPAISNKKVPATAPRASASARPVAGASPAKLSHQRTVVYLVSTAEEGSNLEAAIDKWQMEVEALGVADQEPRRVVVIQTRDEVLHQRIIDFGLLASQAPGLGLDVIDLRD